MAWYPLNVPASTLRLRSLICGQTFRWVQTGPAEYTSTMRDQIVTLKETEETIYFALDNDQGHSPSTVQQWLTAYFRLALDIQPHYEAWCRADPTHFEKKLPRFPGLRMIQQPPFECLCSYICSSNNHIARITNMVQNLAIHFGRPVTDKAATTTQDVTKQKAVSMPTVYRGRQWYTFPEPSDLVDSEAALRDLGFGYRARYIQETAKQVLAAGGEAYLYGLRHVAYKEAHHALLQFAGVGPKVADCVALSSLDQLDAVPVDTHVLRIATRDYGFRIPGGKSLTAERYMEAADLFRTKFGPLAGWAQLILFSAELRQFKEGAIKKEENLQEEVELTFEQKENQDLNGETFKRQRIRKHSKTVKTEGKVEDIGGSIVHTEETVLIESIQTLVDEKGRAFRRSKRGRLST